MGILRGSTRGGPRHAVNELSGERMGSESKGLLPKLVCGIHLIHVLSDAGERFPCLIW